jgi:hypothetical protein
MFLRVVDADFARAVMRFVFPDNDFKGKGRLLHQDAIEALGDEPGVLISGNDYGNQGLRFVDRLGLPQKLLLRCESAFEIELVH